MATIGTLVAFDPKKQTWDEYTEILEQFFAANGIDDAEKQRAILISVVGAATYSLMRNLLSPAKPKDKTFQELVLLMKNHFDPKPSEIVQSYKFDSRSHKPNETVMEYVVELRRLAQDYRIVCGIKDDQIQRRLLSEIDLTFDKALSIAVAMETANKNAQDLQTSGATAKCFSLTKGQQESRTFKGESKECYRCKGTKHTAADCKYKQEKCHACGKMGHIARACTSKTKLNQKKYGSTYVKKDKKQSSHYSTHNVGEKADNSKTDSSEDDSFTLNCVKFSVKYKQQKKHLLLVVVEGDGPSLLGRAWLEEIKLDWSEVKNSRINRKLHQVKTTEKTLQQVLSKHENVFKEELGTLKGMKAAIHVKSDATPRFFRPHSVPFAMRAKVDEEIDRLLKEGIISPVKYAEWAAPVVPLLKPTGTIRLCGDYLLMEDLFATLSGGKQFSKLDMSHAYQQILLDDESKKYVTVNTSRGLFTYNSLLEWPQLQQYSRGPWKRCKCAFMQEKVEYLGHIVDAQGLHPVEKKVKAIMDAPTPKNVTELKAYLGLLNYYNKFLPNLATLLAPLHELLRHEVRWTWQKRQEEAFQKSKNLLNSAQVLVHYSADRELVLSCDPSPYAIGAVLSHKMEDGSERPLGFMSRTLSPAEKKYSQLDKKGLAVIFGIKKFNKYLYGRVFTIYTDHKPLISLFNEKKPIPQMGSPRVQRWAVTLSTYEYNIRYKPGKHHENADALSQMAEQVLMMDVLDDTLVDTAQIKPQTDACLKPYRQRKLELSVRDGCVLWGARVIIPTKGRDKILKLLHQTHTGMSKMKGLARSYACEECQKHYKSPLHPWEWPESPWSRIHVDYAGPFLGEMFLITVDAHSKWMDIYPVKSSTSQVTIEKLRQSFSVHGTCFTSAEFESFMKQNGIDHVRSAPFHPSSNGLAERAVQTFKEGMKKVKGDTLQTRLSRFLFSYRITPHATTGLSLAELMMSQRLRSVLDLLMPDKENHDTKKRLRSFTPGDKVFIRNYSYGPKWIPAVIVRASGPVSYIVTIGSGQTVKRHVDQVRARVADTVPSAPDREVEPLLDKEAVPECCLPSELDTSPQLPATELPYALETPVPGDSSMTPVLRRSQRERRPPETLKGLC
ncbi:5-hydroxytryptamine receptor 3 [Sarotherodon galilaeus]